MQKAADEILRVPRINDFDERPTAETAVIVDRRDPQRASRCDLGSLVFLPFAGHFDNQVQEAVRAAAVVDAGDEVGDVVLLLGVQRVGDVEAEVVILDIANDLGHVFEGFGHFLLPRAGIGDDVGDVALVVAGRVDGPGGVEVHITGRANGVIRMRDRLER